MAPFVLGHLFLSRRSPTSPSHNRPFKKPKTTIITAFTPLALWRRHLNRNISHFECINNNGNAYALNSYCFSVKGVNRWSSRGALDYLIFIRRKKEKKKERKVAEQKEAALRVSPFRGGGRKRPTVNNGASLESTHVKDSAPYRGLTRPTWSTYSHHLSSRDSTKHRYYTHKKKQFNSTHLWPVHHMEESKPIRGWKNADVIESQRSGSVGTILLGDCWKKQTRCGYSWCYAGQKKKIKIMKELAD